MSDFDLVLAGTVVLPDRVLPAGFVAVRGGKVAMIGVGTPPAARERHLLGDALILPGAIDAQVHSLSQKGAEDFVWSTRSAAAGGVTTIVDMPYDDGNLIANAAAFKGKVAHASAQARVDFALHATIAPDEGATRVPELVEAGAAAFKFSTFGTHPVRFPRIPPHLLAECFAALAKAGIAGGVHNEDHEAVEHYLAAVAAAGITDWRAHGLSRPPLTELLAMHEIYEIGAATGCDAHVVHCSLPRGYDIAAAYRGQGFSATAECCIHYLVLDEENDVRHLGGKAKINPPIRPRAEVEGLWRQVANGNVWLVSTDHVSWTEDRKTDPNMLKNASGVPGLEAMVPLFVKGALQRGVPLTWAARLMSLNPAKHFRLDHVKGALTPGRDADIIVMTPEPYTYDASASGHNVVGWSPYNGIELPYRVAATYVRGEAAFNGKDVLAQPGSGQFQRPLASRAVGVAA
jgi:allantoinase